jgi:hypothetical protein
MKEKKNQKKDTTNWYRLYFYGWSHWSGSRSRFARCRLVRYARNCWNILRSPHYRAILWPRSIEEKAVVAMLRGWLRYADGGRLEEWDWERREAWTLMGWCLQLISGAPLGRLERSELLSLIMDVMEAEGYDPEAHAEAYRDTYVYRDRPHGNAPDSEPDGH